MMDTSTAMLFPSKLKYTAFLVLIASSSLVDAGRSSSISRPHTTAQAACSAAFNSKDVAFCASQGSALSEPALLAPASSERALSSSDISVRGGDVEKGGVLVRLKIGFYFALWYVLNIVYNSKYSLLQCLSEGDNNVDYMLHALSFVQLVLTEF